MPFLDVYIGDPNDPEFKWVEGGWNGKAPRRISPFFPPSAPFYELIKKIEDGKFIGFQVDWSGWVTKITKEKLEKFIEEYYTDEWYISNKSCPHILKQMVELQEFINKLHPEEEYIIVATEL